MTVDDYYKSKCSEKFYAINLNEFKCSFAELIFSLWIAWENAVSAAIV
jgi:hypothetical protein